eukprot:m51a1_g1985 putative pas domain-containing protein tyrosine kinase (696) ;mRNA; r:1140065-1153448
MLNAVRSIKDKIKGAQQASKETSSASGDEAESSSSESIDELRGKKVVECNVDDDQEEHKEKTTTRKRTREESNEEYQPMEAWNVNDIDTMSLQDARTALRQAVSNAKEKEEALQAALQSIQSLGERLLVPAQQQDQIIKGLEAARAKLKEKIATYKKEQVRFDRDYASFMGNSDPKSMYTYLDFTGTTGPISFDENGDRYTTITLYKWIQGNGTLGVFGNWTIELRIGNEMGHGSFGTVYQAEWRGVQVAAKVIRTAGIRDIDEGKLLQEVTIMKALRHPNLLLFMCYLKSDTSLTIVSEYMPGGSLLDVLSDRATPMPVGTKLGILGDVAAGMAYLHGSNPPIIHRDLKSSNVLLSASMQAKVCDFGLTVIAHKHGSAAEHRDDSVLGSLLWSAPEVVDQGLFSTKSDVYAFGVMVWETVMRELPYSDTNPVLVATRVVEGHRPQVGPEFDSVQPLRLLMEECWHQAPAARPEFAEIITRLEHARELLRDVITVAVKKFFRQKVDSITTTEIELQIKEIVLISEIRHPNILLFIGACVEPSNMFIMTEWMDRGSLRQVISSDPQMDKQRGIAVLGSVCNAMTYLHKCNVVHRDLKSTNILLSSKMVVKVSDFGLAAIKTANKISTLCGAIAWMAPEVISNGEYSEASDVYSFGVVMHEILSCEMPFNGLDKIAVVQEIMEGRRPVIPKKLASAF